MKYSSVSAALVIVMYLQQRPSTTQNPLGGFRISLPLSQQKRMNTTTPRSLNARILATSTLS